ncbi:MAG TPA: membrane dipeptidase [Longimicrobiales bacterium]|nr:membrane dipeptidase [Longimicrobiales bacterium]
MTLPKQDRGYTSFSYLEAGADYRPFRLAAEPDRVEPYLLPLAPEEEERVEAILRDHVLISLHEHVGTFPDDIGETPAYVREGRVATAFQGLAQAPWDCVFDNLLDGICTIRSRTGWQWDDVLYDLGMRLCDLAHQDFVIHARTVADIHRAHREGRVAWVASMEGAAMIENELDRIDLLHGFGVRLLGITYSEANALGSGLKEPRDGGLTVFGRKAVARMNRVGMLIDCSHCGDQTTLDTIEASEHPIVLSHIGARALWDSARLAPDEVLTACAAKGGVIGVEAAPHTTLTPTHRRHGLDAYMEHFEYIKSLVGIEHVSFGPDTLYGDHVGLHGLYAANLSLKESRGGAPGAPAEPYPRVEWVQGLENPTEAGHNILRWLVRAGYSAEEIGMVMGGNTLRVLEQVWA